jgi:hypothetical protein
MPIDADGWGKDSWDLFTDQLRYKLAPGVSGLVDFIAGSTAVGEELPEGKAARAGAVIGQRMTPLAANDIIEAERELDLPQGTIAALESFLGASVSTYGPKTDARRERRERERKRWMRNVLRSVQQ